MLVINSEHTHHTCICVGLKCELPKNRRKTNLILVFAPELTNVIEDSIMNLRSKKFISEESEKFLKFLC